MIRGFILYDPWIYIVVPRTVRIKSSEGETDQSSTSVLATLAALAEASGPLNASNAPSKFSFDIFTPIERESDSISIWLLLTASTDRIR